MSSMLMMILCISLIILCFILTIILYFTKYEKWIIIPIIVMSVLTFIIFYKDIPQLMADEKIKNCVYTLSQTKWKYN